MREKEVEQKLVKAVKCNAALYRRRKKHFVFATPSLLTES